MPNEEKDPEVGTQHKPVLQLKHYPEPHVVIEVPSNTTLPEIEAEIHKALAEQPKDFLVKNRTKELILIIQHETRHGQP